ncbi:MAG: DUF1178 family protein [Alphaproteobacteria bacterium]|nr:DUF1178 family protein [Alphaproteobacteria bacterium]
MISFNLRCAKDHVFEAWFKDSKTYDRQSRQGKVACPVCGDVKIAKAPMAPNIAKGTARSGPNPAALRAALGALRKEVEKNCDYVGDRFADEARKIHYKETDQRNIYGEATESESRELIEEGVEFGTIPVLPKTDS